MSGDRDPYAVVTEARRLRFIAAMPIDQLEGYVAEAKRRGLEPYEVTAIAERRRVLSRRK